MYKRIQMNLLHFAGSNNNSSINRKLAFYAASVVSADKKIELDLNDFEMPIYSAQREKNNGVPEEAHAFFGHIKWSDGIIMSLAEHNGSYSVAFKNIFDWVSRIDQAVWQGKSIFLLSTSPGTRGGATVLDIAAGRFPFNGGRVVAKFSLPSFYVNFKEERGIIDDELNQVFEQQLYTFVSSLPYMAQPM